MATKDNATSLLCCDEIKYCNNKRKKKAGKVTDNESIIRRSRSCDFDNYDAGDEENISK